MKLCRKSYKHFVDEVFFQGLCELAPLQLFYAEVFTLGFTLSISFNVLDQFLHHPHLFEVFALGFTTSSTFVITPCRPFFPNFVGYRILWSNDQHEIDL